MHSTKRCPRLRLLTILLLLALVEIMAVILAFKALNDFWVILKINDFEGLAKNFETILQKLVPLFIAVGQWLVSGLHWSSSARQSLAARQKELSE